MLLQLSDYLLASSAAFRSVSWTLQRLPHATALLLIIVEGALPLLAQFRACGASTACR
jgi:hypothetical protein